MEKPRCKYCEGAVWYGPGMMIVESSDGDGFTTHEECYQQSGDDEGYVGRIHQALEEEGIE